ncbi:MAG: hypothetical protein IJC78_00795 [Clostridia bacterium]|nr:hypothetical protein [Clostridia bacterium]
MKYQEQKQDTEHIKQSYLDGLYTIIKNREQQAAEKRKVYAKDILKNGEAYREDFKKMLGWPMTEVRQGVPEVTSELLSREDGYSIFRMQFFVLEDLALTGLFFRRDGDEKKPLILAQHGGLGTPELISGIYGDTTNYNDLLHRILKHDVHVFAPQLVLWDKECYGAPYDRERIDAALKRVGSSVTAVELYGLQRVLDYFEAQSYVKNFGMAGLSYGGFYTLFLAAADTRILSSVSCSFFNTRDAQPRTDWTWQNAAELFDDAEISCLVYPRKICLQMGDKDELFDYRESIRSFERMKEISPDWESWTRLMVFDGTHEFCKDDAPIETMIKDLK